MSTDTISPKKEPAVSEPFLGCTDSPMFSPSQSPSPTRRAALSSPSPSPSSWQKTKRVIIVVLVLGIIAVAVAVPLKKRARSSSSLHYSATANTTVAGTTLLIDNDLEGGASDKKAVIMLGPRSYADAVVGCSALGESLWGGDDSSDDAVAGIQPLLNYLMYQGHAGTTTRFWIDGKRTIAGSGRINSSAKDDNNNNNNNNNNNTEEELSALCTQSAPYSNRTAILGTSSPWTVRVRAAADRHDNGAGGVAEYVGNRDHNSFRFLGIRFAPEPKRFGYAAPYWNSTASRAFDSATYSYAAANTTNGSLPVVKATSFGSMCAQSMGGSEDCLFLNIFTPYLPPQHNASTTTTTTNTTTALRPVMLWIHGGGLTGGSGSDVMYDGGNFASRGDVVVVTINYRLATFGYLALDNAHGGLPGNYGLADQVLALDWVRDNIAAFGGDPDAITIAGQSAGAASVRALMATSQARGKFVGALPMSNLGGLVYGQAYSQYYSIAESTNVTGLEVLEAANCTDGGGNRTSDAGNSTAEAIVACLRAVRQGKLSNAARHLVVDGTYLTSDHLELYDGNSTTTPYALLMGVMRDDGAPFIDYPLAEYTTESASAYLEAQGYDNVSQTLFPLSSLSDDDDDDDSSNDLATLFDMGARVSTDAQFRCIDEATVYAGVRSGIFRTAYYYEFDRAYQLSGWPGGSTCQPAATASHPHGDPSSQHYYRCHSGELYYFFGNVRRQGLPLRDKGDMPFMQYVVDSFAAFVRTQSPNVAQDFLRARGFTDSLRLQEKSDAWTASTVVGGMAVHKLDWPRSRRGAFPEQEQCASLGLGLEYYLA